MAKSLRGVWLALLFFLLASCSSANYSVKAPEAANGLLNLQSWDFNTNGQVNLSGEWEFYWRELLSPSDVQKNTNFVYEPVPDNWISYKINGQSLPPEGFATYRLVAHLPDPSQIYGLYIDGEGTAYTLWVDGKLLAEDGQVATTAQEMIPHSIPLVAFFQTQGNTAEFVIEISNFNHRKAGFRNAIILGLPEQIHAVQRERISRDAALMGIYLVMALYHAAIFWFRRTDKSPFYFALWGFVFFVRTGLLNQKLLLPLLPTMSWDTALRLEYITFYFMSVIYVWFIQALYTDDVERWVVKTVTVLGIGFTVYIFFVDTLTASRTVTPYQVIILLELVYFLIFIVRILLRKREGARYIASATAVGSIGVISEILSLQNIIPFKIDGTATFLAFILIQAVMLASRLSKAFQRSESLSEDLQKANLNLAVNERKYRSIFEDSKDMIFIAMLDEQIKDSNPASRELLGYSRSEMVLMKMSDVLVHRQDKEQIDRLLWKQPVVKDYPLELRHKDGSIVYCTITLTLRKNEEGKVTELQGTVHDISAIKQAETERLRAMEFEQLAITDPLTKIYNRRVFDEIATKEWELSKRSKAPLSVVLFDIDHFKKVNDSYGHLIGDQVLANLSELCSTNLRGMDVFARYGGEEFVVLMPDANSSSAHQIMERLRTTIQQTPLAVHENADIIVTISAGITTWKGDESANLNLLLERADQALYTSKESGRNRVTIWKQE